MTKYFKKKIQHKLKKKKHKDHSGEDSKISATAQIFFTITLLSNKRRRKNLKIYNYFLIPIYSYLHFS